MPDDGARLKTIFNEALENPEPAARLAGAVPLPSQQSLAHCIRRLLMALKPEAFQKCFQDWIAHAIRNDDSGPDRLVAIDSKTCQRSHDASQQLVRCTLSVPGRARKRSPWAT